MLKKIPNIRDLITNAEYINKVGTNKTVYYVFQTDKNYLIFSYRNATYKSGNFNYVAADTVARIHDAFIEKKRVTSKDIQNHPQMKKFITRFDFLHVLYVLVAKKQASIDKRSMGPYDALFQYQKVASALPPPNRMIFPIWGRGNLDFQQEPDP